MAKKISELPEVTDVQDADEYELARAGSSYKITAESLMAAFGEGELEVFEFDLTANEANGFSDTHVIEYDDPLGVALIKLESVAFDSDGLPTHSAGGVLPSTQIRGQKEDLTFGNPQAASDAWVFDSFDNGGEADLVTPGSYYKLVTVLPEVVQYRLFISNFDDAELYSGSDSPSSTVHVTVTFAGGGGGALPAWWTVDSTPGAESVEFAGEITAMAPLPDGTFATSPFAIGDRETAIVVNRAGGFVGAWEVFDLGKPGVGYGRAEVVTFSGDGETWASTVSAVLEAEVSQDGASWFQVYGSTVVGQALLLIENMASALAAVGAVGEYVVFTPRYVRFRVMLLDFNTGELYAGANDPELTYDFDYTAG